MPRRYETGRTQETNQVKVVLQVHSKEIKTKIFKMKNKPKRNEQIWLSDDLTPSRSKLAFMASAAVKPGRAAQTWVFDGKRFLRVEKNDKLVVIRYPQDIPRMTRSQGFCTHWTLDMSENFL